MFINGLNAEQKALLEQLGLGEDVSIREIIKMLEILKIYDEDPFGKSFNEGILNSTVEVLKNIVL